MKHLHLPALPPVGGAERSFQKGDSLRAEHSPPLGDEGTGAHAQGPGPSPEESRVYVKRCRGPNCAAAGRRGYAPSDGCLRSICICVLAGFGTMGQSQKIWPPVSSPVPRKQTVRPRFPSGRPAMIGLAVSCREPFTTAARCGRRRPGSAAARVAHYEDQTTTRIGLITSGWRANRADTRL